MRRPLVAATVASMAVAAAYALSPLGMVLTLTVAWIVHRGLRGLEGRERQVIGGLLVVAAVLRFLAVLGVFLSTDPWREPFRAVFGDALFTIQRSLWVMNSVLGEEIGPWYRLAVFDPYGGNVFYYYLAYLHLLFGPSPYAITLLSVTAFLGGSVLMYRAARAAYGPVVAGGGLAILLFWPTFFVWSVSMLQESIIFLLAATIVTAVWWLPRTPGFRQRAHLVAGLVVAVVVLTTMRDAALLIVAGAVALGVAVRVTLLRAAWLSAAVVACIVVVAVGSREPRVRAAIRAEVIVGLFRHTGHWASNGVGYRIADTRFYTDGPRARDTMTELEGLRFLTRAAVAFVLVPLPWQIATATASAYVPEQFLWLALIGLAVAGAWIGFRRDPLMTSLLASYCVVAVAVIAPNSGNVGTLIRHRDAILPFVVWLSVVGFQALLVSTRRLALPSPRLRASGASKGSACA